MNYIWELAIKAKIEGVPENNIVFSFGRPFSGYMELSFIHMNETEVILEVEINPYYRYYAIFKELFEPNVIENEEMVEVIHDTTIHHLKDIDVFMGMNKKEYYIKFVILDMYKGILGEFVKDRIDLFTNQEQKILANNILNLYKTSECIFLLTDTVRKIFTNSYVFSNTKEKDEVILFLRTKETKEDLQKIELIKYIFLPFRYNAPIYWEYIFGVIDNEEFMKIGEMLNY